ncbi:MAG TPA: 2-C-methyl-D-erythritol 4-phosphate cytidylyltransferase, partial [Candidatus Saccharimonadales bacterium]|nr:2-C-methyl-D-erythritol 4-phosphate cytidylyltransferase [Candidatus Saccharimonadales bacterium]
MAIGTGVAAIVLAAGNGRRMRASTSKVFLLVGSRSILARTLELFERMPIVETVVLVATEADHAACVALVGAAGFQKVRRLVTGGASRHASEYHGLLALEDEIASGEIDTVLIHDAVRPFVTAERVEAVVAEARRTGAAILAIQAGECLVMTSADGTVHDAGDNLWVAQTPQAFRGDLVLDAHRRAAEDGFVGTDTSAVVERLGHAVSVVSGEPENIKITTSDDLLRAELIADQMSAEH